jgi:superfamily I DNA/RNA helicase
MTTPAFVPSPEQQQVIAHRGGHLQVVACAGAGKTEAISRRVSTLIERQSQQKSEPWSTVVCLVEGFETVNGHFPDSAN